MSDKKQTEKQSILTARVLNSLSKTGIVDLKSNVFHLVQQCVEHNVAERNYIFCQVPWSYGSKATTECAHCHLKLGKRDSYIRFDVYSGDPNVEGEWMELLACHNRVCLSRALESYFDFSS